MKESIYYDKEGDFLEIDLGNQRGIIFNYTLACQS